MDDNCGEWVECMGMVIGRCSVLSVCSICSVFSVPYVLN